MARRARFVYEMFENYNLMPPGFCFYVSTLLLPARSGSGHLGHPRWPSKPYMKLIVFMCQLASCPPDLDQAILAIPDGRQGLADLK